MAAVRLHAEARLDDIGFGEAGEFQLALKTGAPRINRSGAETKRGRAWRAELDGPLFDAARRALAAAFGREPVITGEGGSIPVVGDFERVLGAPVLLMGFGLPGENAHAPDEWMSVENFEKGMRAIACLWEEIPRTATRE